jgi:serine/threonine-protein kinase TNNI3K
LLQQRTRNGFTALHIAIYKGEKEAVQTLLEAGADPNGALASGVPPPLHLAAMAGNAEVLFRRKWNKMHLLHLLKLIQILVANKANLQARDFVRYTALHCAVYFGNELAVKELITVEWG